MLFGSFFKFLCDNFFFKKGRRAVERERELRRNYIQQMKNDFLKNNKLLSVQVFNFMNQFSAISIIEKKCKNGVRQQAHHCGNPLLGLIQGEASPDSTLELFR